MARKSDNKKGGNGVYKHDDSRKNAVPVRLASYDASKLKPKKYVYNLHLYPQLVWAGKAEHAFFEVPTVSQAFLPDSTAWDKLKRALKASIDEDKSELLIRARSLPFKLGHGKRIVVKVIEHRGNEVVVVRETG